MNPDVVDLDKQKAYFETVLNIFTEILHDKTQETQIKIKVLDSITRFILLNNSTLEFFLITEVKKLNRNFTEHQALDIAKKIIYTNFAHCAKKYLEGEKWEVENFNVLEK